ncbi:MAG: Hsp20 family protein [Mycobacteriaceae bacterium]|nr:Hsp20 family protein [Mycobacteriaceae bacterium]
MNKLAVARQSRSLIPELSELFTGFPTFPGIPAFAGLRPIFDTRLLRMEEELKDGRYEMRAEIPGVEPAEDLKVSVRDGQLTIKAERTRKTESNGRSEFSYGSFVRTVSLPVGADEDDITAVYDKGILTVSVAITEPVPDETRVEVQSAPSSDVQVESSSE